MAKTSIEWTQGDDGMPGRTWNPIRGCSLKSTGCRSCYAMKQAHRFSGPGGPYEGLTRLGPNGPTWTGEVRMVPEKLAEPLTWRKPARIFVNSMSDLFHEDVPDDFIDHVFAVMGVAHWHTFQVLTKRADRMAAYFAETWQVPAQPAERVYDIDIPAHPAYVEDRWDRINKACDDIPTKVLGDHCWGEEESLIGRPAWPRKPYANVWLGISCENQATADERIPHLLRTPAAVRFLSCEPLLGPVDLQKYCPGWQVCNGCGALLKMPGVGHAECGCGRQRRDRLHSFGGPSLFPIRHLDWVIVGGESGPGARPMHPQWARDLRDQCQAAGAGYFFKQWGGWAPIDDDTPRGVQLGFVQPDGHISMAISGYEPGCPCDHSPREEPMVRVGKKAAGRLLDGRTWDQFPEVNHERV